jgi:hypothetical protein
MSRVRYSTAPMAAVLAVVVTGLAAGWACAAVAPGSASPVMPPPTATAPRPSLPTMPSSPAGPSGPAVAAPSPTPTASRPALPVMPPLPVGPTGPAVTPTSAPSRDPVQVTILGIKATNEDKPSIAPSLQPIAKELARSSFNSFRETVSDSRDVAAGGDVTVPMDEAYALRIHLDKDSGDSVTLTLLWQRSEVLSDGRMQTRLLQRMQIVLRKGRFFLSGGWKLKDGALWAAVSAQ